ncbi:MAG: response regulator transcription factor [Myxococcota bacterium]|jgi:DNA-binding response OmpR family regulator|nr:response regulator transcription factor [Myxococcota bacterium]
MARLLLVEDDPTLRLSLEVALRLRGHEMTSARLLADAQRITEEQSFDLILLDLGLPDGDGLELCHSLRRRGSIVPILMLTARGTLEARVEGLGAGADDYLAKPFELPELVARVEALLRRKAWHGPGERTKVGRLEIDFRARQTWQDGKPTHLTDMEYRVLEYLLDRRGDVVSREELLLRVWRLSPNNKTRTVDVFMSRLRKILQNEGGLKVLLSVRGEGYRLLLADESS